jgi:hypothetical protein
VTRYPRSGPWRGSSGYLFGNSQSYAPNFSTPLLFGRARFEIGGFLKGIVLTCRVAGGAQ